jgi:hypothetical protein
MTLLFQDVTATEARKIKLVRRFYRQLSGIAQDFWSYLLSI